MLAYKQCFLEQRDLRRRQDLVIKEYDYVVNCINNRNAGQLKMDVYGQLLLRIKQEYEKELEGARRDRSISASPDRVVSPMRTPKKSNPVQQFPESSI